MPTVNYFVSAKKRKLVPVYVRFSAGRKTDLIVKSGMFIDPRTWSNVTQSIKQRIKTTDDSKFLKSLANLKDHIESEFKNYSGECSKEWLTEVVYKFHNKKATDAKTLNDYIQRFIDDAEKGDKTNKAGMKLAFGTVNVLRGFKHVFNEYQGIYTEDQLKWHEDKEKRDGKKKPLRPLKKVDFDQINIDFYVKFVKFLSDEGYKISTQGRFIRSLKMFMRKALDGKIHQNREFMHSEFRGLSRESFSVYLTTTELDKIYNIDLPIPLQDVSRDAFLVLCETALRVSDYRKVDVSIRMSADGTKLIYLTQTKTGGAVIIPCSARLEAILTKYNNTLPKLPDQYINVKLKKSLGTARLMKW